MIRELPARAASSIRRFFQLEIAGGLLLVAAAALGMAVANSMFADTYATALAAPLGVMVDGVGVVKTTAHWINDGLMVLFFLLVGLELKRELAVGQFADRAQIGLPLACAFGGMIAPMAIYWLINRGDALHLQGIAIPAATDIAFALGAVTLLGSRVPLALKLLLTAIAVIDDLGAIVIIAVFYTSELSTIALGFALAALVGLVALNRANVVPLWPYLLLGIVLWFAVLKSGVHATLAGVALGMTIPVERGDARPLDRLEHALQPWVAYAILPIFAFANAGVPLAGITFESLAHPVSLGIALGLVLGKPIGVMGMGALVVWLGLVRLPSGVRWPAMSGMAVLCGIGFTMSLFIGSLAFDAAGDGLVVASRIGILGGSLVAALFGYFMLRAVLPKAAVAA